MTNSNCEELRRQTVSRFWMQYFNDTLLAQGVITEDERNRMRFQIDRRYCQKSKNDPHLYSGFSRSSVLECKS